MKIVLSNPMSWFFDIAHSRFFFIQSGKVPKMHGNKPYRWRLCPTF